MSWYSVFIDIEIFGHLAYAQKFPNPGNKNQEKKNYEISLLIYKNSAVSDQSVEIFYDWKTKWSRFLNTTSEKSLFLSTINFRTTHRSKVIPLKRS